jgi:hypothetical protein
MLGFLLPSLFACQQPHKTLLTAATTSSSYKSTISSRRAISNTNDEANPSCRRRSKWIYQSLLLMITDWVREPLLYSSLGVSEIQHSGHKDVGEHATNNEMLDLESDKAGNSDAVGILQRKHILCHVLTLRTQEKAGDSRAGGSEAGYTHALLLEEGRGSPAGWSRLAADKNQTGACGKQMGDDDGDEDIGEDGRHDDASAWTQCKGRVTAK